MRRGLLGLTVIALAAGLAPAAAIPPLCLPGAEECVQVCIPALDLCLFEDPPPCEVPCPIDVTIESYWIAREPGAVLVHVEIAGTLAGAPDGTEVSGEVTITAPNPCWPDASGCVDVIDVQTVSFTSTAGEDGAYRAIVGPFKYTSDGTGPACWTVHVDAEARHGASSAADEDDPELCA